MAQQFAKSNGHIKLVFEMEVGWNINWAGWPRDEVLSIICDMIGYV